MWKSAQLGPKGGALIGRYRDGEYAATIFGRSPRDTNCDYSASNEPNMLQSIYLRNDKDLLAAMNRKTGWLQEVRSRLAKEPTNDIVATRASLIQEAFFRTLGRPPTPTEIERGLAHFEHVGDTNEGLHELLWALLNLREFITNH